ncbi:Hsp70 family protein [Plantactinospora solaniradicis]|uniref:Hsp70 family protein n=1 Tax=Plantactinospora solaniradicis TaxID=1723736 RepID=A0ABW1K285_9ACTN
MLCIDSDGVLRIGHDAEIASSEQPRVVEPSATSYLEDRVISPVEPVDLMAAFLQQVLANARGVNAADLAELRVVAKPRDRMPHWIIEQAAARIGLPDPVRVPTAAAAMAGLLHSRCVVPPWEHVVVVDIGGGDTTVSLVVREDDGVEVRAGVQIQHLGGVSLDAAVARGLLHRHHIVREDTAPSLLGPPHGTTGEQWLLWRNIRRAREMVSATASTSVELPDLGRAVRLTALDVERFGSPQLEVIAAAIDDVVEHLGPTARRQPVPVWFVGGTSRMRGLAVLGAGRGWGPARVAPWPRPSLAESALRARRLRYVVSADNIRISDLDPELARLTAGRPADASIGTADRLPAWLIRGVAEVLSLSDELAASAPGGDRVKVLANRSGLSNHAVATAWQVRNQCAHPHEHGWPQRPELNSALATLRELRRRIRSAPVTGE